MTQFKHNQADAIEAVLDINQVLSQGEKQTRWLGIVTLTLFIVAAIYIWLRAGNTTSLEYRTELARQGDLTVTVSVTGKLQPVNEVDVGTELSGTIKTVAVDYNNWVKAGQVLAKLDTDLLEAKLRQSQAALELAQARVKDAEATVTETHSKFYRAQELLKKNLGSQENLDVAEAAYARAEAGLAIAKAQVAQAKAQLDSDRTVLDKATIHSPINGIVLERRIEPGQTVAAQLQIPVFFKLAENLTQMELHVDVDQADVSQVKEGQQATFNVDAYPDRSFPARITEVRYAPRIVEGVVTYETVLSVDNSALLLRPGMTVTAEITVNTVKDALLVPNAALRFTPPVAKLNTENGGGGLLSSLLPGPPQLSAKNVQESNDSSKSKRVWTLKEETLTAIPVTIGATDSRMTQVLSGNLEPAMPLVVDSVNKSK
ncbi:MAG: efflux RND transporter periplasmic adaptor subunit [Candidatus Competibacteraceae bacterium]